MTELSEKQRDSLDEDQFAFPKERKEPLNNASHVRNAIARFNQVEGRQDDERDAAWSRIKYAAKKARRRGQREELARARQVSRPLLDSPLPGAQQFCVPRAPAPRASSPRRTGRRAPRAAFSREALMDRKYIDCRDYPSESGCTVAISADSADEVVQAAAEHAVKVHGHQDTPELREQLRGMVKEGAPA